ncbi:hypothetical protein LSAT2_013099, partial [Lamellibrachia satsuma]
MPETLNKINIITGACNDMGPELPRRTSRLRMSYLLAVIAVLLMVVIPATHGHCPTFDRHCYCRYDGLICENLGEISQLPPFHPCNTTYKTMEVTRETTLKTVQANTFRCIKVKKIELSRLGVTTIEPGAFSGLGDILESLDLTYNKLATIPDDAFKGLEQSLTDLNLDNNRLTTVSKAVFSHLTKLEMLYIGLNQLHTIEDGAFNGLNKLWYLYLYSNRLTTLSTALFRHLTHLAHLDLMKNHLETIINDAASPDIFSRLKHLRYVRLITNRLVCDCRLAWLRTSKLMKPNILRYNPVCFSPPAFK